MLDCDDEQDSTEPGWIPEPELRPSQRRLTLLERLWVTFAFTGFVYCLLACAFPILIAVVPPQIDLSFVGFLFTKWGFLGAMVVVGLWCWVGDEHERSKS